MEVLRDVAIRFISILMYGALIPPLVLLILAYFNERLRRILLAILFPLALIALIAFYIWAPRVPPTFEAWQAEFQNLRGGFATALPLLILLGVLIIAAILFGPTLRRAVENWLHQRTRREYLLALLDWLDPQLAGMAELEGRETPNLHGSGRITGAPGMGKSILLRQALFAAARQALGSRERPLPVFLDLDARLASSEGLHFVHLSRVLPVQVTFLGWLLKREGKAHQLMFFVDGSVQSYGQTFAQLARPGADAAATPETAVQLAQLAEAYFPCPFVLALPSGGVAAGAGEGSLTRLAEPEIHLEPLSEAGVQLAAREMVNKLVNKLSDRNAKTASKSTGKAAANQSAAAAAFATALMNDNGAWHVLAARPALLNLLARFFVKQQRLPANVCELFRTVSYPSGLPAERVEEALVQLAQHIIRTQQYQQPAGALTAGHAKAGAARGGAQAAALITALVDCGLLRRFTGGSPAERPGTEQAAERVAFVHPIFLAYFTALGWQQSPLAQFPAEAIFQAETVATDPVLGDALIFFNNLEADPTRLAQTLAGLVQQGADQGDSRFGRFLAAQCLLAMPAAARPPALVEQVAAQLLRETAYEPSAGEPSWLLMEPLNPAARLSIYHQALAYMEPVRLEQTLRRLEERTPGTLDLLLDQGEIEFIRTVGAAWAECEPRDALERIRGLYASGLVERRRLAVELFGRLPREAVEDDLHHLLEEERDPQVRIAILRSLAASGAEVVFPLLERIADRQEAAEVRIFAAEELAELRGPQMESGAVMREIVRVSRMPMPDPAWQILQRLLERLRGPISGQDGASAVSVDEWEALANPYVIGRPVTDPQLFFGREKLLYELRAAVESGTPLVLTGERRCGKSSLLLRLLSALQEEARQNLPLRCAYLDLEGLLPNEFYETTIRALIEAMGDPNLEADPNIPRPYTDQPFGRDLGELLAYMRTKFAGGPKAAGPDLRLALLIDNADGFFGYPQAFHAALHRVFNACAAQGLVIILAGVDPLRIRADGHPPFYEEYRVLPIPRFTNEEGQRLITVPVAGTFTYEPAAIERILQVAQGRPAEIQSLCQILIGDLLESGEREVTLARVEAVLRLGTSPRSELLTQAENLLGGVMDWLEAHPEASNAQAEEQIKKAWGELQKAFVQQATRLRKRN